MISWLIISLVSILPWCNLLSRLGWSTTLDDNKPIRAWTMEETLNSLWHIRDFNEEFQWSLQLCSWTAVLSLLLAIVLIGISKRPSLLPCIFGTLGCMIALPGPLINLAVSKLMLGGLPESLSFTTKHCFLPSSLFNSAPSRSLSDPFGWHGPNTRENTRNCWLSNPYLPIDGNSGSPLAGCFGLHSQLGRSHSPLPSVNSQAIC